MDFFPDHPAYGIWYSSIMFSLVIVDDEFELRDGLSKYFPWAVHGFEVTGSFGDCASAFAFCKAHPVDVLLCDIRLPFQSGFDLIDMLSKEPHPPLFCIMSAYNNFDYAKQALQYGVQDFLVKPASFDEIGVVFDKLRSKLESSQLPAKPVTVDTKNASNPLIAKAITIMEKQTGKCSLQSVAFQLDISAPYLSRLFKETVGETFQSRLTHIRMESAKRMLESNAAYTNREIAHAIGYQDPQNFCRAFKAVAGETPQKYRDGYASGK